MKLFKEKTKFTPSLKFFKNKTLLFLLSLSTCLADSNNTTSASKAHKSDIDPSLLLFIVVALLINIYRNRNNPYDSGKEHTCGLGRRRH